VGTRVEEADRQRIPELLRPEGIEVEAVRSVEPTLEDVFVSVLADDAPEEARA